jgi:hypothetical protein
MKKKHPCKKLKTSREECENSREIVRRRRGWCFLGRINGKISLWEYL